MRYLVCENRAGRYDSATIHINGKCQPQGEPGAKDAVGETRWWGYYKTLGDAIAFAMKSGRRHIKKCDTCFR